MRLELAKKDKKNLVEVPDATIARASANLAEREMPELVGQRHSGDSRLHATKRIQVRDLPYSLFPRHNTKCRQFTMPRSYEDEQFTMVLRTTPCMVTRIARVWINRVRLPILLVVR